MAVMESISFCYDGKYSVNFGIYNVSLNNNMHEEQFFASRSIVEQKIRGNSKPYFQGVEYEPLTLSLSFAFEDTWNDALIRDVARWLRQDYYKPLWFAEDPGRIFYCMCVDDSQLVHNGLKQGYITLKLRCDSPYTYSPVLTKGWLNFSTIIGPHAFEFVNDGDVDLKPELWIKKIETGPLTILNKTNGNETFNFSTLLDNETIYVDNETEYIETDLANTYRYGQFNNKYLKLVRGKNVLEITGRCNLNFRYQYRTLQ
jgi:predicted phage tail component-like protein